MMKRIDKRWSGKKQWWRWQWQLGIGEEEWRRKGENSVGAWTAVVEIGSLNNT
jgi:hypothetical protein